MEFEIKIPVHASFYLFVEKTDQQGRNYFPRQLFLKQPFYSVVAVGSVLSWL